MEIMFIHIELRESTSGTFMHDELELITKIAKSINRISFTGNCKI